MAYEFNHYYELQNVATGKYVNVLGNHEDETPAVCFPTEP